MKERRVYFEKGYDTVDIGANESEKRDNSGYS